MRFCVLSALVLCFGAGASAQDCDQPHHIPCDVRIGMPVATPFSRAFPLLDGLYQDLAAMQVTPLSVSPAGPNAASLDALLQQFQVSLQYNTGLGIQNSLAEQQAATASANIALQNTFVGIEQQLYTQVQAAQKDALAKHQTLDGLAADDSGRPAAQQAATQADDTVTQLQNQLTTVQKLITITPPASTSFSSTAPGASGSATNVTPSIQTVSGNPPAPAVGTTADKFVPSFPAYKQMEVQAALLRERLTKLVSVLSQQADFADKNLLLVEFHASPLAARKKRKGEMLSVEYVIQGCGGSAFAADLFPRNSTVNISNEKYRDSRWGISSLVSLFSFGLNSAYNREHLQISQSLGEAAYITGFGIAKSRFGWTYGLALGEDTLAPGDRETFALVAAPKSCTDASVALAEVSWSKSPPSSAATAASPLLDADGMPVRVALANSQVALGNLTAVSYSPVEYDPGDKNAKPVAVVNFRFADGSQIDSEATLTANGAPIKRARDNFFRGSIPSGSTSSTGLLEASDLSANTWIPLGPNQIAVSLDPTALPSRGGFPRIVMSIPGQAPLDLTAAIASSTSVIVAGQPVVCPSTAPCSAVLPPLALPKPSGPPKTITAARFLDGRNQIISITVDDSSGQSSAAAPSVKAVQLISASESQKWGTPFVLAQADSKSAYLKCTARGGRLECMWPDTLNARGRTTLTVTDLNYEGGMVFASADLKDCKDDAACNSPLPSQVDDPVWDVSSKQWLLRLSLNNVGPGKLELYDSFDPARKVLLSTQMECNSPDDLSYCEARFRIQPTDFARLTDDMTMRWVPLSGQSGSGGDVSEAPPPLDASVRLFYIRQLIEPIPTQMSLGSDHTSMTIAGKNLVFEKVQIGSAKTGRNILDAECIAGVACSVTGIPKDVEGYVYFVTDSENSTTFPLLVSDGKGAMTPYWWAKAAANQNPSAPVSANDVTDLNSRITELKNSIANLNLKNSATNATTNLKNSNSSLLPNPNRHVMAGQNK